MKIILHVGLHKTGTTFLQERVFSKLGDETYFEKNDVAYYPRDLTVRGLTVAVKEGHDTKSLKHQIEQQYKNTTLVISGEGLCQNPYRMNYKERIFKTHEILPTASVILFLRYQPDWIASLYTQTIHARPRSLPIHEFLNYRNGEFGDRVESDYRNICAKDISYCEMIDIYRKLYGKENVHVFFYEHFLSEPRLVLKEIFDIIGVRNINPIDTSIKVNRSYSALAIKLTIFMKKITRDNFTGKETPSGLYSVPWKRAVQQLPKRQLVAVFAFKAWSRIGHMAHRFWRRSMHGIVDKIFYADADVLGEYRRKLAELYVDENLRLMKIFPNIPNKYLSGIRLERLAVGKLVGP